MPDPSDPYEAAVAQRDKLALEIAKMEQKLRAARAEHDRAAHFIEDFEHFARFVTGLRFSPAPAPAPAASVDVSEGKNPTKEEVAALAVKVLLERGEPLSRADLFAAMQAQGLVLYGKDPIVVLSTMLWRMKSVVSFVKGTGYWPMGHAMPGRHVLNGRVVTDHVVTEADTDNADVQEAAKILYPHQEADPLETLLGEGRA